MDNKRKKQIVRKNFLESLRELGSGVAKSTKKDLFGGVAKASMNQVLGKMPQGSSSGGEASSEKFGADFEKKEKFKWSGQAFTKLQTQERVIFKKAEEEIKIKIEAVRAELVKLIKVTQNLSKEVKIAAVQAPIEPGIYHLNFLERLRSFIVFMRKNIAESRNWLAMCNQKSKKRNYYWRQAKKSGTKFTLSSERYSATQTG